MKRRLFLLLACSCLLGNTACAHNSSNDSESKKETSINSSIGEGAPSNDTIEFDENQEYQVGDTISIWSTLGEYELTIDAVSYSEVRNEYAKKPKNVILIDYTYTNHAEEPLLIDGMYFQLTDGKGIVYEPYYYEGKVTADIAEREQSISAQIAFAQNDDTEEFLLVYQDVSDASVEPISITINNIK